MSCRGNSNTAVHDRTWIAKQSTVLTFRLMALSDPCEKKRLCAVSLVASEFGVAQNYIGLRHVFFVSNSDGLQPSSDGLQ